VNIHSEVTKSGGGEVVALDVQATSRGLERWMGNEGMRALAGAKGRTYVMESYGWESNAREWCKHYEAMITA
jgi:glycosyltransferase involved in cell wall biosynthesis